MLDATKAQIDKLKVDALYGKKKHFNAADRKTRLRLWLSVPVIIINAALGSLLMSILQEDSPDLYKWLAALLSIVAAILSGVATFLDLAKQVEGHRRVGNKYTAVVKQCERLLAYEKDSLLAKEDVVKRLEELAASSDEANREAEGFHTSESDYKKARSGIQSGEEEYLPSELRR